MGYFALIFATVTLLFTMKTCSEYKREIRKLNSQVADLKEERPELYHASCMRAVNMACYYADCAVTPIEIMQEKICKPLEEE